MQGTLCKTGFRKRNSNRFHTHNFLSSDFSGLFGSLGISGLYITCGGQSRYFRVPFARSFPLFYYNKKDGGSCWSSPSRVVHVIKIMQTDLSSSLPARNRLLFGPNLPARCRFARAHKKAPGCWLIATKFRSSRIQPNNALCTILQDIRFALHDTSLKRSLRSWTIRVPSWKREKDCVASTTFNLFCRLPFFKFCVFIFLRIVYLHH